MGTLRIKSEGSEQFSNRTEAGDLLAHELEDYRSPETVVLGIPRGGIIVAQQISVALEADLDIVLSHKLRAPANSELAIGAVCEDGKLFIDKNLAFYVGAEKNYIRQEKASQLEQINQRVQTYRQILPKMTLEHRIVIITDDGVATGATMQAALWAVRKEIPEKIILALPVGPKETLEKLSLTADETICLEAPLYFEALGRFYLDFRQVEDDQLFEILEIQRNRRNRK